MDMEDDCIIEEVTPKIKKLKQARLQFQTLCSSESSPNVSTKKRKLESPGECKTPKIVKITNNENTIKDSEVKNGDLNLNKSLTCSGNSINLNVEEESNKSTNQNETKRDSVKSKRLLSSKTERKESLSPTVSLTKFFKKSDKKQKKENSTDDRIQEDKNKEEADQWNVSVIEDTNENCDEDLVKLDDDSSELKSDVPERSPDTNSPLNDKTSCVDSDSDNTALSSDNEDDNIKETTDKETKDINDSSPKTPKQTSSEHASVRSKRVTPKVLQRQMESAKKREEREKLKMEKEVQRENRRKEKEAEKEQKRKEKEQKELKKQMEMEQKQKEKEAKEQERRKKEEAKEEEKKKKEEEKLEAERKKQKAASNFVSFFVAKKQEVKATDEENNTDAQMFMPFEIKADMRVAPITRRMLQEQEKLSLDEKCRDGRAKKRDLYLAEIKEKRIVTRKSGHTWPFETKDEVILLEEEENDDNENDDNENVVVQAPTAVEKNRAKLLQFHENRRPPYWGTWRKQSKTINPRRPFYKDSKWFDYEVDSDDEWEEEEPGESLHGSEDEKDEENPDDDEYDVDNEFMVPHGYLSDEEARADEEENEDMTPETQKFKLKILGEQFEAERNEKMLRLKPKIIGCLWLGPDNTYPENTPKKVVDFLTARHAWVAQIPVVLPSKPSETTDAECHTPMTTKGNARKTKVPEEALPDLIRLIHGNTYGRKFLVREFLAFWCKQHQEKENQMSKASLVQKISEIGKWMSCPDEGKLQLKCWYVPEEIRKEYLGDEELPLPNRWKYTLTPKRKREIVDGNEKTMKPEKEKKMVPLITQFTKKITQDEMKRQLSTQPAKSEPSKPILLRPPKRVLLISLPRIDRKSASETSTDEPENKKPDNDNNK